MEVDEGSDKKPDSMPHWMASHARLKIEFTEDEKYHNLMRWLIVKLGFSGVDVIFSFSAFLSLLMGFHFEYYLLNWKRKRCFITV